MIIFRLLAYSITMYVNRFNLMNICIPLAGGFGLKKRVGKTMDKYKALIL